MSCHDDDCYVSLIIVIDVEFDYEFLSGLIIKIEHGGEILTSFLARSIETKLLFEADTTLIAFPLIS